MSEGAFLRVAIYAEFMTSYCCSIEPNNSCAVRFEDTPEDKRRVIFTVHLIHLREPDDVVSIFSATN